METIEEIEEFYERDIENTDREFFDDLKNGKNRSVTIKKYQNKLKQGRLNYEKRLSKFLNHKKSELKNFKNKKLINKNKKDMSTFIVKKIDFDELEKQEIKKRKKDLFRFRMDMRWRNYHHKIPNFLLVFIIKSRLFFRRSLSDIFKMFTLAFSSIKNKFFAIGKFFKNNGLKSFNLIKKTLEGILNLISRTKKKEKEKGEEKGEEKD